MNRPHLIAETVKELSELGINDPNFTEIAERYYEGAKIGKSERQMIQRYLPQARRILQFEFFP